MKTVLITGGSGMVGMRLSKLLSEKKYTVIHLSHSPKQKGISKSYLWNIKTNYIADEALKQADIVIHLAGAPIAEKRWTKTQKNEIFESRCKSTQLLYESLKRQNKKIDVFITASAVGFYGAITTTKIFTEEDLAANDFIGNTCKLWEQSSEPITSIGIRTIKLRIGVVLSNNGGALSKMAMPIKLFLGATLGNGKQFIPWIHIDDLCELFLKCIEDKSMEGAYNAVAQEHISNDFFIKTIAKTLKKPLLLPAIPKFLVKLFFGEMANIILEGSRVSSEKVIKSGFSFKYPTLTESLKNLFK